MQYARYQAGLNDFEYCASLHIEHPSHDPDLVTKTLGIVPVRKRRVGERRQTPQGTLLEGVYETNHWHADLLTKDGEDLSQFLSNMLNPLDPAKEFLVQFASEGGRVECMVGLFATNCCDSCLSAKLLGRFAEFGVDLRLDYYGPLEQQPAK
jgi:hypothetical protein